MRATCVLLNWKRPDNLGPIIRNLPDGVNEILIWDNSGTLDMAALPALTHYGGPLRTFRIIPARENLCTLGRFIAATMATNEQIITQDDDCLPVWGELLAAVNRDPDRIVSYLAPGHMAMAPREYRHPHKGGEAWETLLGWGGAFPRWMILKLLPFTVRFPDETEVLRRKADRIFAILQNQPHKWISQTPQHLPGAWDRETALFRRPDHRDLNQRAYTLCRRLLDEQAS